MKPLAEWLIETAWNVAIVTVVLAIALATVVSALHSRGYRASLYTVAPCAPAVQAAPHALSINPLEVSP